MTSRRPSEIPGTIRSSRDVAGGRRVSLELEMKGEHVPSILLLPNRDGANPAALLLHGFTSRKERMAEGIGNALLMQDVATLSIDLPLHGAREGSIDELSLRNPLQLVGAWRLALTEAREAISYLSRLAAVDSERLAVVGYSLGSFLAVSAAATDQRVQAVVLAAGGDLPKETPFATLVRAAADPLRAVRKLAGRPLLMVNGRYDRTVKADQAERLFAAAAEPKELRWYQGGHWPPPAELEYSARWLATKLRDAGRGSRGAVRGARAL